MPNAIRSILIEMRFGITERGGRQYPPKAPRLVRTGSFDRVLLTGGKNLTLFQSVALVVTGLGVALGAGVPILVHESYLELQLGRFGYHRSLLSIVLGCAFILWGAVMFFNGLLGIARRIWKRNRAQELSR
jgi:hypothetical protein